jgi:hypothetical protein
VAWAWLLLCQQFFHDIIHLATHMSEAKISILLPLNIEIMPCFRTRKVGFMNKFN